MFSLLAAAMSLRAKTSICSKFLGLSPSHRTFMFFFFMGPRAFTAIYLILTHWWTNGWHPACRQPSDVRGKPSSPWWALMLPNPGGRCALGVGFAFQGSMIQLLLRALSLVCSASSDWCSPLFNCLECFSRLTFNRELWLDYGVGLEEPWSRRVIWQGAGSRALEFWGRRPHVRPQRLNVFWATRSHAPSGKTKACLVGTPRQWLPPPSWAFFP